MEPSASRPVSLWWQNPERVESLARGVFEGGGAKGILYVGALEGTLRRKLWFSEVAGASAGAIVATLVACGMEPRHMRSEMEKALDALSPPRLTNAWRRLRCGAGFLDQTALRDWLRGVLGRQCQLLNAAMAGETPTFEELFAATHIDLFVVAADLSARQVMVFNRKLTPRAEIASAVTASASIPLAFTPMHFITAAPDTGTLAERKPLSRVVADGGIAANYPAFVFTDKGFRKYVGLESDHETNPVVGFLLDEEPDQRRAVLDLYRRGQFAGTLDEIIEAATTNSSSAWPKVPRFRRRVQPRSGIGAIVNRAWELLDQALYVLELPLLTALSVLGGLVDRPAFWKWPSPANRHVRLWMSALRPWIATSPVPLVLGVTAFTLMFSIGFSVVAGWVVVAAGWVLASIRTYRWSDLYDLYRAFFKVSLLVVAVAALVLAGWIFVLGLGSFGLLRLLYPTLGWLGHPLVRTFLQAPAAPPWAGCGENETVVRLQVPAGLTTLGAGPDVDLDAALTTADHSAFTTLDPAAGSDRKA